MDFLPGKSWVTVPSPNTSGLGCVGRARADVNNALQGMRLVRRRGSGNLKAFVCHTNQKVLLLLEVNQNRRKRVNTPFRENSGLRRRQRESRRMSQNGKQN